MARIAVVCQCGRRLTVAAEMAGRKGRCPSCGDLMQIPHAAPAPSAYTAPAPSYSGAVGTPVDSVETSTTCTICQTMIEGTDPITECKACLLGFHAECWEEYGGCATYGCKEAPKTEKKAEDVRKECPYCGEMIRAKAIRCPSCRERFEDARPVDRDEYFQEMMDAPVRKAFRAKTLGFLAASIVPCLGPIMLVLGVMWLKSKDEEFEKVGNVYRVMIGTGTTLGGIHTFLLILFLLSLAVS